MERWNPGLLERWSVGLSCTHLDDVAWMRGGMCNFGRNIGGGGGKFVTFLALPPIAFWFVLEVSSGDWLAIDVLQFMGAVVGCSNVGNFATILECWSATAAGGLEGWSVGVVEFCSLGVLQC